MDTTQELIALRAELKNASHMLWKTHGLLISTLDVLSAVIASHPDRSQVHQVLKTLHREFPNPIEHIGYREGQQHYLRWLAPQATNPNATEKPPLSGD